MMVSFWRWGLPTICYSTSFRLPSDDLSARLYDFRFGTSHDGSAVGRAAIPPGIGTGVCPRSRGDCRRPGIAWGDRLHAFHLLQQYAVRVGASRAEYHIQGRAWPGLYSRARSRLPDDVIDGAPIGLDDRHGGVVDVSSYRRQGAPAAPR